MFAKRFLLIALLAALCFFTAPGQADKQTPDVRVMSYNIRYGTAQDGENHWDKRKEFLVETIRAFGPDLLGTQETLGFQRDYLAEKLAGYETLGVGRDDGGATGEMTALYFKRERFEKLDGGHFWLSETPDKPGSKSWDTALTRMATWVKLRDRRQPKAKPLVFLNTHFDHRGQQARLESARLLRRRVAELAAQCRVIVTGDFNAGEDSPPYQALFGAEDNLASPLRDVYRVLHPERTADEGTFSNFKVGSVSGPRIDWIGVSAEWQVRAASIDRTERGGRTPSDHFAVTAILRPDNAPAGRKAASSSNPPGQPRTNAQTPAEQMAAEYFRRQTARVSGRPLADVHTLADWQDRRETYRLQLLEMLGLSPLPPRGDLKAALVGKVETEKFTVEKIHFQSLPGLYVTANLYLPKTLNGPAPTVLYLCGHLRTVKNGIAYGTKVGYQHHPAWLAEHGYVALIIDTLEMGEIEGEHHGTQRRGMWWWPTRGYTPAGVETWNAMRALDYLATRPEVDMQRIGVTGRSGGGAYTWFLAAVDDRPSVLIPVAGVTDMTNHVVDDCIDGHCDCMYQVNTYGWDFSLLAALAAPRPLLLSNSDKDRIFPLDGVQRIHRDLKRIYKLYNADDKLGLLITEGPHSDTQDLQVPAFRWLNRWLKKDTGVLSEPALKRFEVEQLKVFTALPTDQINTRIHETFVSKAPPVALPSTRREWQTNAARWSAVLREKVFNNWPATEPRPAVKVVSDAVHNGVRARLLEFQPDEAYRLQLALLTHSRQTPARLAVHVLDDERSRQLAPIGVQYFPALFAPEYNNGTVGATGAIGTDGAAWLKLVQEGTAIALVLPRGIGPTAWPKERETHIRRRFLLLGQSLETMQVWDTRSALAALRTLPQLSRLPVSLRGSRTMGVVALFAALFEDSVKHLELEQIPATLANGPSFPNVLRFFDLPQLMTLALPRTINLTGADSHDWEWSLNAAKLLEGTITLSQEQKSTH
jgi:endonuclease/exonuclease/phosphatase family metal-dependent hydrolase/dienelactone hydrolase